MEGGEGETWGGIALTQADGSAYSGQDSGLERSSDGESIFLFSFGDSLVFGIAGTSAADAEANFNDLVDNGTTDDLVFAVALNDSGTLSGADNESSADVWFVQFQAIEHGVSGDGGRAQRRRAVLRLLHRHRRRPRHRHPGIHHPDPRRRAVDRG
jgi:hypothetical protein